MKNAELLRGKRLAYAHTSRYEEQEFTPPDNLTISIALLFFSFITVFTTLPLLMEKTKRSGGEPIILVASLPALAARSVGIEAAAPKALAKSRPEPEKVPAPAPQTAVAANSVTQEQEIEELARFIPSGEELRLAAQVHYITEIIASTRNKRVDAAQLAYLIVSESQKAGYDPLLVASVVFAESSFRKEARSPVGAVGLMQIMPATGKFVAKLQNLNWTGPAKLKEPRYNMKLGIAYLKYLHERYRGNLNHMLIAYNWGPANFSKALKGSGRRIPNESRRYTAKIIGNYTKWRKDFAAKLPRYRFMDTDVIRS